MNVTIALLGTGGTEQTGLFGAFFGGTELVVIFLAILVLFGAKKIPEFAKGLGQGIREFKKASSEVTTEFHNAMNQPATPPPPPAAPVPPAVPTAPASPPSTVPKT